MRRVKMGMAMLLAAGLAIGAGAAEDGRAAYEKMRAEVNKHATYTATVELYSARGKDNKMYTQRTANGKYLHAPKYYCETMLKVDSSFDKQAVAGHQECYQESDNINHLLLPGAYRLVGEVQIMPEDPKAFYINGTNVDNCAVWEFFTEWDRMLEGGQITAESATRDGKTYQLLTIRRGKNPDPDYHLDTVKIYVDPATSFPMRAESYRPGEAKPAQTVSFSDVKLDAPLTPGDMKFTGFNTGISLSKPPGGEGLDKLVAAKFDKLPDPAPAADELLKSWDAALGGIKDYTVAMTTRLRYYRLRLNKTETLSFLPGAGFKLEMTAVAANYMLFLPSVGTRLYYVPGKDPLVHLIPAGVYKVMGDQTFAADDPRLFTSMGDNLHELNFPALRDKIKARLADSEIATAKVSSPAGIMLELKAKKPVGPREPKRMIVILDEKSHLPIRVDYRDYTDPQAFLQIDFADLKTNQGLTAEALMK